MQRRIPFLFYDMLLTLHSTLTSETHKRAHTHTHTHRKGKNVALFNVKLYCFFSARQKDAVYWDATQGSLTEIHRRFDGACFLSLQDRIPFLHEDGASIHGSCPFTSKTSIFPLSSDEDEISYI